MCFKSVPDCAKVLPHFQLIPSNITENIWKICLLSIDHNMSLNVLLQYLMLKVSGMQVGFLVSTHTSERETVWVVVFVRLFDWFKFFFVCLFSPVVFIENRGWELFCAYDRYVCFLLEFISAVPWLLDITTASWLGTECWQLSTDTASINASLRSSEKLRKVDRSEERVVGRHEKCARVSGSSWYLNLSVGFEVSMGTRLQGRFGKRQISPGKRDDISQKNLWSTS